MILHVTISDGPLAAARFEAPAGCGGILCFEGVVRELEDGARVGALLYETYEPMAQRQLESIGADLIQAHALLGLICEHSRGRVPVGACSFRLVVFGKHRKETLAAADEFIDRLKKDVPIWKHPEWLKAASGGEQ